MVNLLIVAMMMFTPSILLAAVQMVRKPGASFAKVIAMGAILAGGSWLVSSVLGELHDLTGWTVFGLNLSHVALIIMVAGLLLFPVTLILASLFGLKDDHGTIWPGIGLGVAIAFFLHNNMLATAPITEMSLARLALDLLSPMLLWPPYRMAVRGLKNWLLAFGSASP